MRQLSRKDRRALLICGAALLVFGMIQFVLFPLLEQRKRLERGIRAREQGLEEMRALQAEISQFSRQNNSLGERVARRPSDFSLFNFLEQKAVEGKLKENILYMKPSDPTGEGELQQVAVEIKFQDMQLHELVELLERIESPEHVVEVERLTVQVSRKAQRDGALDVIMRVISLVQAKKVGD
ncbi:type II secretion system protein GspM [Candidatus Electronema sp. TJ]|uniref:type II secretion system protein GspM n=1 Tax=Candidatus Electronema sp. TJ TaxID=3401573 RepID=UPI003AA80AFD